MIKKESIAQYVEQTMLLRTIEKVTCSYEEESDQYCIECKGRRIECKSFGFEEKSNEELLEAFDTETLMFEEDIVETVFFFLSGYWEFRNPGFTDSLRRYLGTESFSYRKSCLLVPVVDILIDSVFKQLQVNKKEFYKKPKLCVTHDIDFLKVPQFRLIARDFLKQRNFRQGFQRIKNCLTGFNPYDLGMFLNRELQLGLKPICFLLNRVQKEETAGGYMLSRHKKERKEIARKAEQGVEFGLHYSTDYLDNQVLGDYKEIEKLTNKRADFGRAHYLIFELEKSFEIFEKNKIMIDFSAGYRDCVGFRFGTSLPFQPYDYKRGCAYHLVTIPLILMDGTWVLIEKDLDDDSKKKEVLRQLLVQVQKTNGLFTILWHNTSQAYDIWGKYEKWYWKLISSDKMRKLKIINVSDIYDMLKERDNFGNRN